MSKPNNIVKAMLKFFRNYLVMVAIALLVVITIIFEPKAFISLQNLKNIMSQFGGLSFVSLGMTIAIIGGFIDLSVAGIINFVAVVTIALIQPLGQIPALIVGLGIGALFGWLNSLLILSAGAMTLFDALFITFGMSTVGSALAMIVSGGSTQQIRWIKGDTSIFQSIGSGSIGIFSVSIIIFFVCLAVLHIFQSRTYRGRAVSLVGGNKMAANLSGIPVRQTIMMIFTISGLMAALGAIVLFSRVTTANPTIGAGYETEAILAVVVGGTTLKGGNGSVLRTFLGVLLVTLLANCMDLLGVTTFIQLMLSGIILMVAIWLDNRKELKGEYR